VRMVIASEFVSADGCIAGPNGGMSWVRKNLNEEMGRYARDLMASMDAVMLGRATCQTMAGAWPNPTEERSPGADKMNGAPKYALSRTLEKAPWGSYEPATMIGGGFERKVPELKERPGRNTAIYGSANAVRSPTRSGPMDEHELLVHPVFLGEGEALFRQMERPVDLRLARTQTYRIGVSAPSYEPVSSGA